MLISAKRKRQASSNDEEAEASDEAEDSEQDEEDGAYESGESLCESQDYQFPRLNSRSCF